MTDVVAVALVSAGSSLLGASVGALTTYKVNLRNMEATIATAKGQHEVELARIEAENQRLKESNREEERRNRQSTYHQHLSALHEIFTLMGFEAPMEMIDKARTDYRTLHAGIVLFAPPSVRDAAYEVGRIQNEIWPAVQKQHEENPGKSASECWRDATAGLQERFGSEIVKLTAVMHADVTRGIADDPATVGQTG